MWEGLCECVCVGGLFQGPGMSLKPKGQNEEGCDLLRYGGRVEVGAGPLGAAAFDHELVDFLRLHTLSATDRSSLAYSAAFSVITGNCSSGYLANLTK